MPFDIHSDAYAKLYQELSVMLSDREEESMLKGGKEWKEGQIPDKWKPN